MNRRWIRICFAAVLLIWLILDTHSAVSSAEAAIRRCTEVIFPSLFPFFALSNLLLRGGLPQFKRADRPCLALLGVPACGLNACWMGFLGGYPLGAAAAADLYRSGAVSRQQAQQLLYFCNNTGPAFIFGMVGTALFPDNRICITLYAVHIVSALLTGVLMHIGSTPTPLKMDRISTAAPAAAASDFPSCVRDACFAVFQVCGYVIFFSVLLTAFLSSIPIRLLTAAVAANTDIPTQSVCAVLSGIMDLPSGMWALTAPMPEPVRLVICGCTLSWGGICVHMQTAAILRNSGLSPSGLFSAKALQAGLSCLIMLPLCNTFFGCLPPFSLILVLVLPGLMLFVHRIQKQLWNFTAKGCIITTAKN